MAASKNQTGCQPEALIQIRLLPTAWLYSQFRAGTLTLDSGLGSYFDPNQLAVVPKPSSILLTLVGGVLCAGRIVAAETS
jgi:hypothetical protein